MSNRSLPPSGASRPRALAASDAVVIDGEVIVYASAEVHHLNSTAALIWQSCDGRRSLDALALDLAVTFQVDPAAVRRDVVDLAGSLAERGLIAFKDEGDVPAHRQQGGTAKPVVRPAPACSGCGNGPDYDCQILVDVGNVAVAIGADSNTIEWVEAALGDRVLGRLDAPTERPSYGVVLPEIVRGRAPQPVARLHRGPDVLFRSRDPQRVLRALLAQVSTHAVPDGSLGLEAVAIGRGGRAVLVPVPRNRVGYARTAARFDLLVSDPPVTLVGIDPPTVSVGCAWPDIDLAALRSSSLQPPRGREPASMAWGGYELMAIAVWGVPNAAGVLGDLALMGDDHRDDGAALGDLVRLARSVPILADPRPEAVAAYFERMPHRDPA